MIGVDTNVLVRLFVSDDARQHRLATKFFDERTRDDPAYISVVTLVEFFWVLKRSYKRPVDEVLLMLRRVINSEDAVVENFERVRLSVKFAMETGADLADVLITDAGLHAGCSATVTFDGPAADAIPGMELLK